MFRTGDVIRFDPSSFNPKYWNSLTPTEINTYYGVLMDPKTIDKRNPVWQHFVFITEINQSPGHCVLVNQSNGEVEMMRHTNDFSLVPEDEC